MTARIIVVRHGNTFDPGETVRRVGGRTDLPLSASGLRQAEDLAAHLADRFLPFAYACCGPLARTRMTAERILRRQSSPPVLEIEPFLREIDYGPDENRPESEVLARIGAAALVAWEEEGVAPEGWRVDAEGLVSAWREAFGRWQDEPGDRLVVTSNGVARFALEALGDGRRQRKLATGAYGVLIFSGGAGRVDAWNLRP
jgi:probable phosphoglycerate mutase